MVTAGSWEPSSMPRRAHARGRGRVHDSRAPALAAHSTQAENHRPRYIPGTPPVMAVPTRPRTATTPAWRVVSRTAHLLAGLRGRTRAVWSWGHNLRKQELPAKAEFGIPTSS